MSDNRISTGPRTSIVARLRIAFSVLAVIVLLAVLFMIVQLRGVAESNRSLQEQALPHAIALHRLHSQAVELLAIARQVESAEGRLELINISDRLYVNARAVADNLAPLAHLFDDTGEAEFQAVLASSSQIVAMRLEELVLLERVSAKKHAVSVLSRQVSLIIEPYLDDLGLSMQQVRGDSTPNRQLDEVLSEFVDLVELRVQIEALLDFASRAVGVEVLEDGREWVEYRLRVVINRLIRLPNVALKKELARRLAELKRVMLGDQGLVTSARTLGELRGRYESEFSQQFALLGQLAEASREAVKQADAALEQARLEIDARLTRTYLIGALFTIVTAVLLLIVGTLIIERQLNRRVSELARAAREISEGNTDAEIRVHGADELGGIAASLEGFKQKSRELQRSNAELEQFAHATSHDMRSPLRAIAHLAAWALEDAGDNLPDIARGHLQKLNERVGRLTALLEDTLAFSRLGAGESRMSIVDVRAVLVDICEMYDADHDFGFDIDVQHDLVSTYEVPLNQILRNLIGNVIKHHDRDKGNISVISRLVHHELEIQVIDDGPGIAPRFHDKIFDLFQTLKPRDHVEGSGIGLAAVKKIVHRYGGSVRVESEPDTARGSTFIFRLPAQPATEFEDNAQASVKSGDRLEEAL